MWKGNLFFTFCLIAVQSCSYPAYFPHDEDLIVAEKKGHVAVGYTGQLARWHTYNQFGLAYCPINHFNILANYNISQKTNKYFFSLGYFNTIPIEKETHFYYGINSGAGAGSVDNISKGYYDDNNDGSISANYLKTTLKIGIQSKHVDLLYAFRTSFHDVKRLTLVGEFTYDDVIDLLKYENKPLYENSYRLVIKNEQIHFYSGLTHTVNKGILGNPFYQVASVFAGVQVNISNL